MKRITKSLSALVTLFAFFAFINILPANADEQIAKEQITDRTGSYSYDVSTGIETFIPISNDDFIQTRLTGNDEANVPAFVPQGLSIDPPSDVNPLTVFNDNWTEVNPATGGQYRNTVYINITSPNGSYRGTGFMIGPNTVATCGHCIYNSEYGANSWASSATIIPARAGSSYPYGTANATHFEVGGNWADNEDQNDDWGIIRLDTNIGYNVGWLGLKTQSGSYNGTSVNVNGYPSTVGGVTKYTMYRAYGTVTSSYSRLLCSNNINNVGGMSGGPMYIYSSQYGYQAIAFTRGETSNYNVYVRIDDWIFDKFNSYRDLTA